MEGLLLQLYSERREGKSRISVWIKQNDNTVHLTDYKIPTGPKSIIQNYMYHHRLNQFAIVDVVEEQNSLKFKNYGVANLDYLTSKLKFSAFDIEVKNPHRIPDPLRDPIIAFGVIGNGNKKVVGGPDEDENFMEPINFIDEINPDILGGHNSDSFDLPYIYHRSKVIGLPKQFLEWGREKSDGTKGILRHISEVGGFPVNKRFKKAWDIEGRIHIDELYFARWYLPNLDNRLSTVSNFFGLKLPHEKQEKFFEWVEANDFQPIIDHCGNDIEETYYSIKSIFPSLWILANLTYSPVSSLSRASPVKVNEMIVDACILDKKQKIGKMIYRKSDIDKEILKNDEKIFNAGIYNNVEIFQLSHFYLDEIKKIKSPIGWAALRIFSAYEYVQDIPNKLQKNAAIFMLNKLSKELYSLINNKNYFYFNKNISQEVKNNIKAKIIEAKEIFSPDLIFLDDDFAIIKSPNSLDKCLIYEDRFIALKDGQVIGLEKKKRKIPEYIQDTSYRFIEISLSEGVESAIEFVKRRKELLREKRISLENLKFTLKIKKSKEYRLKDTEESILSDYFKNKYGYEEGHRVNYVITNSGFADLSKKDVSREEIDTEKYIEILNEHMKKFCDMIGFDIKNNQIQKKLF